MQPCALGHRRLESLEVTHVLAIDEDVDVRPQLAGFVAEMESHAWVGVIERGAVTTSATLSPATATAPRLPVRLRNAWGNNTVTSARTFDTSIATSR